MENVAHALAGALIARGAIGLRRREGDRALDGWLVAGSVIANNVPDLDMGYARLAGGVPLGYLLHHRGHTHTLVGGVALGVLAGLLMLAIARSSKRSFDRRDRAWLIGLCALGPIVHVAMDGWNVYGVHPFWPLYDGWIYGDSVFIFEPWLWAAGIPPLLFSTRSRLWRAILGTLACAVVALAWLRPDLVRLSLRIAFTASLVIGLAISWRLGDRARAAYGIAAFALVAVAFFGTSAHVRGGFERRLAADFPQARTHDLLLSPGPADPLCWMAIAVQVEGEALVVRRARAAAWPGLLAAGACRSLGERSTARTSAIAAPSDAAVRYEGETAVAIARLRELDRSHCEAHAILQFVRAPFVVERGERVVVGDLRFDHEEELGFAEIEIDPAAPRCPRVGAPWTPPLQSFLRHR